MVAVVDQCVGRGNRGRGQVSRKKEGAKSAGKLTKHKQKGERMSDVMNAGDMVQHLPPMEAKNGKDTASAQRKSLSGLFISYSDIRHCNVVFVPRSSRNSAEKLLRLGKELGVSVGGNESLIVDKLV